MTRHVAEDVLDVLRILGTAIDIREDRKPAAKPRGPVCNVWRCEGDGVLVRNGRLVCPRHFAERRSE